MFGHEAIVSVYHKEEGFEEYIGNGFVLTIQENGFIQVLVLKNNDERHSVLWDKIMSGNKQTLENMIVRPTVSKSVLSSGE